MVAEEFRVTTSRLVQGQPLMMGLVTIGAIFYLSRNSGLLPLWLGMMFPMFAWGDRNMGRSTLWERPVRRTTTNLVRHLTALCWMLGIIPFVALVSSFSGDPEGPALVAVARALSMLGGATLVFTMLSIVGQLMNPRRRYLLPMVAMLVAPLMIINSRFVLGFLPDFVHPVLIGPYGLDVFSGKWFNSPVTPTWRLNDWYIAAGLWITGCLGALVAVGATHQE